MRRLHPHPCADLTADDLRSAYAFPETRPWVRGSMVSTLDGAMRGSDGRSGSVSSPADRRVFSVLRATADVVLVGAGTVRAERYRPSRRPVAIVTNRLDLPLDLPLLAEREPGAPLPIVLTTAEASSHVPPELSRCCEVIDCGDGTVDLARVIALLHDRGLGRIHCEGGPRLLGSLAAQGLLDEVLLTVTPRLMGSGLDEHIVEAAGGLATGMHLHTTHVLEEDGTIFLRAGRTRC